MSGIPDPPQRSTASPWPFIGMIGMASVFFLIGASLLTTPWYVVVALLAVWALALVVATRWWTPHPTWLPWLPVTLALLWFGTVVGGAAAFGWSA